MQTPKAKPGSLEVPQRKSPVTPRTARQLKTPGSESDSVSSPNLASRISKDRSPKVTERKSPRSPVVEKKRPSRVSELELQLAQLQKDLKKVKDQLTASESEKKCSQQEAEESKKHLSAISAKLEESQQQLIELTASEDARVQELQKISHDRDKAWQSELEAVQKQHSMDSAALASAMNEIQKLKNQLEVVEESEASHTKLAESANTKLQSLKVELTETFTLVEKLRSELSNCRDSESQALELVSETKKQLEAANATVETLRSESIKAIGTYNSLSSELEQSKCHAKSLEQLVSKLRGDMTKSGGENSPNADNSQDMQQHNENEETRKLRTELNSLKPEVAQLKAALEASESRYQEVYIQSTLQIRSVYEQFEQTKLESGQREAELEAELKKAKTHIADLRANLIDKETELQNISEENKDLNLKVEKNSPSDRESQVTVNIEKLQNDLAELKASLVKKETQLQNVTEQNEMLKTEIMKGETERTKENDEALAVAAAARATEKEALMKLEHIMEEADKSCKRAARVTEQLDAAQAANTEMEAELRKLKVQSDQWRKAAEAAAAMLSTGNNGKLVERTGSLDSSYNTVGRTLGSPYCDDMDDESPKKKSANMLKKIGVLWKKNQK